LLKTEARPCHTQTTPHNNNNNNTTTTPAHTDGLATNLITYMTRVMGIDAATAAVAVRARGLNFAFVAAFGAPAIAFFCSQRHFAQHRTLPHPTIPIIPHTKTKQKRQ
jgi:hypothetical protein